MRPDPTPSSGGWPDAEWPPWGLVLFALCGSFGLTLVAYLLGALTLQRANLPLGLILTSLFVFGAAGLWFPRVFNLSPGGFTGLSRRPARLVGLAVVVGLANFSFANFLMGVAQELLPAGWSEQARATTLLLAQADPATRVLLVLGAGVAAPLGEEAFFRGWMQPMLAARLRGALSVLVVAVVFSAIHFDPVGFVARVELGLLFGLARLWTGSLWPAIALHATHNLASMAVLYLGPDPLLEIDKPYPILDSLPWALASLAFTIWLLRALHRRGRSTPAQAVRPILGWRLPYAFTPQAGARFLGLVLVVGGTLATLVVAFGAYLPGAELTRRAQLPARPGAERPVPPPAPGGPSP